MSSIYELSNDYKLVQDMASDPEIDPQAIADTLESLSGEIEEKADGYAKVIKNLENECAGLSAEKFRLDKREKSLKLNIKHMKEALKMSMMTTGKIKFKTLLFSFGIQKNPPSVKIEDESKVPDIYLIPQPPQIDKRAIIQDLKNGQTITFATIEQDESLRIR